jgi:hypothetical protein
LDEGQRVSASSNGESRSTLTDPHVIEMKQNQVFREAAAPKRDTVGEFNESIGNWRRFVRSARHRALMLRELDSNVGSTCA